MKYFISLLLVIFLIACQNDPLPGLYGPEPVIELVEVTPLQVKARQDDITFTVRYEDGDGDLGTNQDTARNVFLIDNRIGTVHRFRIQQLAPTGAEIAITGNFDVVLPQTIITDSSSQQTVSFTLYIRDQAGHKSNEVTTPDIQVIE